MKNNLADLNNHLFAMLEEAEGARLEYRIAKILNMKILEFVP